jgi:C4-dicarboxylate transporter DctM subunit
MVMATIPIILLMTPILFPIVQQLGINPIHFGVIMCLNLMIGVLTPPVGLHLFIASSIAKIPVGEVIKEVTPLLCMLILVLILVTYVPQITLWLPDLLIK